MTKRYVNYHCHSMYSNVATPDVVITNDARIDRAKGLGHTVVSGVEHGWSGNFFEVYDLANKSGLKPLLGTEAYFVKDRFEKDSTNAHLMLLAKNENGRKNINRIVSEANKTGFYRKPRVDLSLVMSLPENDVWVTSACLGGIWKYDDSEDLAVEFFDKFKQNFFLEVQYHHTLKQISLNKKILELSEKYGIEIIAGMDSHMIYSEDSKKRDLFLESKHIVYEDEGGWFLDFPDYGVAYQRFLDQGVLSEEQILTAMDNTLIFEDVDEYKSHIFDKNNIKLPTIYPNNTQDEKNNIFSNLIWNLWDKEKESLNSDDWDKYEKEILFELNTVLDTGMADYFLLNYEIIKEAKENGGQLTLTSRGSAPGFYISKLLGFTTIDRISSRVKLFPERFMSKERILETHSLPDIDFNVGNPPVFEEAQRKVLGDGKAYRMLTYQKTHESSAWKLYARAIDLPYEESDRVSKKLQEWRRDIKYSELDDDFEIKREFPVHKYIGDEHEEIYKKSSEFLGLVTSMGSHPCAFLLLDKGNIEEEIGVIRTSGGEICVAVDGKTADNRLFLKNDLLKVTVVKNIYETYDRIGMYPHSVPELISLCDSDDKVWSLYKNGATLGLNQVETDSTTKKVQEYAPKNISELSSFVAAIRPGFKSNYSQYSKREPFEYGIPEVDNLIQTDEFPFSYMLYQENAMSILGYAGIPMFETYQVVKDIAKKNYDKIFAYKERFLRLMELHLSDDGASVDSSEKISKQVWQIIEDSANYSFNACVSGNTIIQRLGKRGKFDPTIEEMYRIKNDLSYAKKTGHKNLHYKYRSNGYGNALSMFDDNRIRKNKIVDIYFSGRRKVFLVETESGESVACTSNHKFPTPKGEKKLSELNVGDDLFVKGVYEKTNQSKKNWLSKSGKTTNVPKKGQRGFQKNPNGGSVLYRKFIKEKQGNKCGCEICNKQYSKIERFECHHKDGDRTNNQSENLAWLCDSCHKKEDYKIGRTKVFEKGIPVLLSKIKSVEYVGEEDVYDIEMGHPAHNFISENGLVTSNSHSYSVANDSLYGAWQKAHHPLEFYETLIRSYEEDGKKDKINLAKVEAEKFFSIRFPSFKWGQDNTAVTMNKEKNQISLSMKTIKGFGDKFAKQMLELSNKFQGGTFLDLLVFAEETGNLSKSKWEKMIKIGYFSEFGGGKRILSIFKEFTSGKSRYGKKLKSKKERLLKLNVIFSEIEDADFSDAEKVVFEKDILQDVYSRFDHLDPRIAVVDDVDIRYTQKNKMITPRVVLHSLSRGTKTVLKIPTRAFNACRLKAGDILYCSEFEKKERYLPPTLVNGKQVYKKMDGVYDWWLTSFRKISI